MGLPKELSAMVENAHRGAGGSGPSVSYVRTEDPGMAGEKAVGAFAGNAYFRLGNILIQLDMVSDPSASVSVAYNGLVAQRTYACATSRIVI